MYSYQRPNHRLQVLIIRRIPPDEVRKLRRSLKCPSLETFLVEEEVCEKGARLAILSRHGNSDVVWSIERQSEIRIYHVFCVVRSRIYRYNCWSCCSIAKGSHVDLSIEIVTTIWIWERSTGDIGSDHGRCVEIQDGQVAWRWIQEGRKPHLIEFRDPDTAFEGERFIWCGARCENSDLRILADDLKEFLIVDNETRIVRS